MYNSTIIIFNTSIFITIIGAAIWIVKAFIKQQTINQNKTQELQEQISGSMKEIATIHKENTQRYIEDNKIMTQVIERSNALIKNNTEVQKELKESISDLRDVTMETLIKIRS